MGTEAMAESGGSQTEMKQRKLNSRENLTTLTVAESSPTKTGGRAQALISDFCEHTSAHGLGNAFRSRNVLVKVAWVFFFVCALGGIAWQLASIMLVFYAFPTHEVTLVEKEPIPFPDVTVCNIEPLVPKRAFPLGGDPNSSVYAYRNYALPKIRKIIERNPNATYLKAGRVESTKGYFENQTPEDTKICSHQLDELIIGCRYAGEDCLPDLEDHFTFLPDGTYYNCFTFSSAKIFPNATGVGPNVGLSLVLYLDTTSGGEDAGNFDPLSNVKQSSGVRVTVHGPGTLPSPLTQGFDIMPGASTAVGLSATKFMRKGDPYGNCTEVEKHPNLSKYNYSADTCMLLYAQFHIVHECGCLMADLPVRDDFSNMTSCGFYNGNDTEFLEHMECEPRAYYDFYGNVSHEEDLHICKPSCVSYTYSKEISAAKWPSPRYYQSFFKQIVESNTNSRAYAELVRLNGGDNFSNSSLIVENFARLNVYFTNSEVLVRSEVPSYESSNLLSDLGGTIGLWAGLSFLTVLEVIVFFSKMIMSPFMKP